MLPHDFESIQSSRTVERLCDSGSESCRNTFELIQFSITVERLCDKWFESRSNMIVISSSNESKMEAGAVDVPRLSEAEFKQIAKPRRSQRGGKQGTQASATSSPR